MGSYLGKSNSNEGGLGYIESTNVFDKAREFVRRKYEQPVLTVKEPVRDINGGSTTPIRTIEQVRPRKPIAIVDPVIDPVIDKPGGGGTDTFVKPTNEGSNDSDSDSGSGSTGTDTKTTDASSDPAGSDSKDSQKETGLTIPKTTDEAMAMLKSVPTKYYAIGGGILLALILMRKK